MVKIIESNIKSITTTSNDGKYRYRLTRVWNEFEKRACVIMLNPSKANVFKNDNTVINVMNYLIDHNYGSVDIVNLFSFMVTKPIGLNKRDEQFEKENNSIIKDAFIESDLIIVAWGLNDKKFIKDRENEIEEILLPYKSITMCFKDDKNRKPRHPRIISKNWSLVNYF